VGYFLGCAWPLLHRPRARLCAPPLTTTIDAVAPRGLGPLDSPPSLHGPGPSTPGEPRPESSGYNRAQPAALRQPALKSRPHTRTSRSWLSSRREARPAFPGAPPRVETRNDDPAAETRIIEISFPAGWAALPYEVAERRKRWVARKAGAGKGDFHRDRIVTPRRGSVSSLRPSATLDPSR